MIQYPGTYEESRKWFHNDFESIRRAWLEARLISHKISGEADLTIDWVSANAQSRKEKLFILSTGIHGIEGYVGSVILQLFVEEFVPRLDPQTTGLLLVHPINPWGMKHHQRINARNVDLNRNFLDVDFKTAVNSNPDYTRLYPLLNPGQAFKNPLWSTLKFATFTIQKIAALGVTRSREATMNGQYRHPEGLYFGGLEHQEETRLVMEILHKAIQGYEKVVHLDIHSGYGPRWQMTLVNSPLEKMNAEETQNRHGVERVTAANPQDFFSIHGDIIDWEYALVQKKFPRMHFFGGAFEFGAFGGSLLDSLRTLRANTLRNQASLHGASRYAQTWIEQEYEEAYCPGDPAWLGKARADARNGFEGILKAEGYLK